MITFVMLRSMSSVWLAVSNMLSEKRQNFLKVGHYCQVHIQVEQVLEKGANMYYRLPLFAQAAEGEGIEETTHVFFKVITQFNLMKMRIAVRKVLFFVVNSPIAGSLGDNSCLAKLYHIFLYKNDAEGTATFENLGASWEGTEYVLDFFADELKIVECT